MNGWARILRLDIRLEIGCTMSAVQASSLCNVSISHASSDACGASKKSERRTHRRKRTYESLEPSEKGEEQEGKFTVEDMFEYCWPNIL